MTDIDKTVGFKIAALVIQVFQRIVFRENGYIGDTATHAGCEVAAGLTQHHHDAACHVFTAMISDTFNDGGCTRVAHGKAFTGNAAEVALATDGAVEHGIADNNVFFCHDWCLCRRVDHQASAAESLADVVIAFANQFNTDAM